MLGKRLWADPRVSVFPITEALRALEAIVRRPPGAVILDPNFVTTSRGAALISRIRQDLGLAHVELRVLTHAEDISTIPLKEPVASDKTATLSASRPPDRWGTRRSVRVTLRSHVTVLLNGERCELVNLSVTGAQILSLGRVSPQQAVRVTLVDGPAETRLYGTIV